MQRVRIIVIGHRFRNLAADLMKHSPVVLDHLAEVLLKLGKTDEAISILREANKLEPGNKDISDRLQQLKGN